MAAVIATGGILAGTTLAELVAMLASGASFTSSVSAVVKNLHDLGLAPHDPVPAEHLQTVQVALDNLVLRPRYAICGVDCHPEGPACNNFCGAHYPGMPISPRRPILEVLST